MLPQQSNLEYQQKQLHKQVEAAKREEQELGQHLKRSNQLANNLQVVEKELASLKVEHSILKEDLKKSIKGTDKYKEKKAQLEK